VSVLLVTLRARSARACLAAPRLRALGFGLGLLIAPGCARQAQLDREVERVSHALAEVESAGALRCAPRELAVARSQLAFALLEREQGSPAHAREHLALSDENLRAARVLSPPERCAAASASPALGPER
jgi:OmpA-OmpF porin, OOP family